MAYKSEDDPNPVQVKLVYTPSNKWTQPQPSPQAVQSSAALATSPCQETPGETLASPSAAISRPTPSASDKPSRRKRRGSSRAARFERHERKCAICHHPDCEDIEEDFMHWHSPASLAAHFKLPDRYTVYRHAHAVGLFELRKANLRTVYEHILEGVGRVDVTADSVIRAAKAYASMTDSGEWREPPTTHIVVPGLPAGHALGSHRAMLNVTPASRSRKRLRAPKRKNRPARRLSNRNKMD